MTSPSLTPGAANFWMDQKPPETPAAETPAQEAPAPETPTPESNAQTPESPESPRLTVEEELEAFRRMLLIRRFEEKAGQLYGMGFVAGFCHLYIGQEAVVTGMMMAIKDGDQIITAYRDHGHILATGMDPKGVMAELTGRQSGYSKGKGGSMHMFSVEKNFYGGHGIVGTPAPLGSGIAFANKYRRNDHVCVSFFGEGAANQGQVYESFNMASLWKLPIVYVIENNHYALGTAVERATAHAEELYHRGLAFGIPGAKADGMDVAAVKAAGERALAHARSGQGPMILEMQTYRYRGHSMSDPAKYRSREEVQDVRQHHDPIELMRKRLLEAGRSEDELKAIDRDIRATVNEAADFAQNAPEPDPAELWTDVVAR